MRNERAEAEKDANRHHKSGLNEFCALDCTILNFKRCWNARGLLDNTNFTLKVLLFPGGFGIVIIEALRLEVTQNSLVSTAWLL